MAELEIIGAPQSTFVRTTRMALEEKGVPYKLTVARPHSPEVDCIHPYGRIPVMRHGDFPLCESRAIIGYVDRVFDGPKLIPDEPKRAAVIEQWASVVASGMFPAVMPYFRENFFPASGTTDRAAVEAQLPCVRQALEVIARATQADGFLAGNDFSIADMYALPILVYLDRLPESRDMIREMNLDSYLAKHAERHSFGSTTPPPFATS